jgi:hypothetical protein
MSLSQNEFLCTQTEPLLLILSGTSGSVWTPINYLFFVHPPQNYLFLVHDSVACACATRHARPPSQLGGSPSGDFSFFPKTLPPGPAMKCRIPGAFGGSCSVRDPRCRGKRSQRQRLCSRTACCSCSSPAKPHRQQCLSPRHRW